MKTLYNSIKTVIQIGIDVLFTVLVISIVGALMTGIIYILFISGILI